MTKHAGGRPREFKPEYIQKAKDYLVNFEKYGDHFPMLSGLADELGCIQETLWEWAEIEGNDEFSEALWQIRNKQKRVLQNKTADGRVNTSLGIRVLAANHKMAEKTGQKTEHSGEIKFSSADKAISEIDSSLKRG